MFARMGFAASGLVLVWLTGASGAAASPIYSQAPAVLEDGFLSDKDSDIQSADDFSLASADTVRSVTWRGGYGFAQTRVPHSFDLVFYGNGADLPDEDNVVSTTTVTAPQVTFVGLDDLGFDVYEFRANVTPTHLLAGSKYWFSAYADTGADADDDFFWASGKPPSGGSRELAAQKEPPTFEFHSAGIGPLYFVLDNAVVPEPSSTSLVLLAFARMVARGPRGGSGRTSRLRCRGNC